MSDKWKSAKDIFRSATDAAKVVGEAVEAVKGSYNQSEIKSRVDETAERARFVLEQSGVTEFAEKASKSAGDHLDVVSGAKLLALVEERLEIQSQYNDILATKLEEALERIAELEKHINSEKA